jgi:transposase
VVLVGDRGMLTQPQLDKLKRFPGIGWISALRSHAIRHLLETQAIQRSILDEQNLAEIRSEAFPGERLIACFNPLLAEERTRMHEALLQATEHELNNVVREVARRKPTPLMRAEIGQKVGPVMNRFKVGNHLECSIDDGHFSYSRRIYQIQRECQLDGIYAIRTSEPQERLSAEDTVRSYKNLGQVEHLLRCLKGTDLLVRPIYHGDKGRVRAHIFLCMVAFYVE